jgi:DNA-binding CsgD family transcriptional regulator/tetratricopeptide (TPR) repeat protein
MNTPGVLHRPGEARFVGRAIELDLLRATLREVADGVPAAVVICGDRGVGKTRLAEEALAHATGLGFAVTRGGCSPAGDASPPGWPFLEALRDAGAPAEGDGHLFERVRAALVRLAGAGGRPVALLVDDLHWADEATGKLLAFLAGALRDERVLLVATTRSDEAGGTGARAVLAELRRSRRARFVELAPFTRDEIAELAGVPPERRDPVVDAVFRRSGGNAYLAEALLEAVDSGDPTAVPAELRDVLLGRFEQLSPAGQEVARALAVGGDVVDHWVLATLDALPADVLVAGLRDGVDRQVLTVVPGRDGYRFKDPLLEELVYGDLLPGERTRLHRAYGQVLEAHAARLDTDTAAKLAHHWYGAGALSQAREAALAIASEAEGRRDFAGALRQYERAIEIEDLLPRDAEGDGDGEAAGSGHARRRALFARAADVAHLAGEHRRASHLISLAAQAPQTPGGAAVLLHPRLVRYLCASGASRAALAAAEEAARDAVGGLGRSERVQLAAAQAEALRLAGRYEDSRRLATEALELARQGTDDHAAQTQILATLGHVVAMLGDDEAAVSALEQARDLAEASGDADDIARAHLNLAELLSGPLGRHEDAVVVADHGVRRADELGLARSYGVALQAVAINTRFRLGWWSQTDAMLTDALACDPTGAAAIDLRLARAKLFVGRGDFAAALDDLDTVEALTVDAVGPRYRVPLLTLRAGLAMWQRRPDYARMAVAEALEDETARNDVWLLAPLLWHGLRAEADHGAQAWSRRTSDRAGDATRRADELLALAEGLVDLAATSAPPVRRAVDAYVTLCRAEHSRAVGDSSVDGWTAAAEAFEREGQPYPVAYARWREAEARLNHRTRSAAAATALQQAHQVAVELGARPFRREVEELAARARIELAPVGGDDAVPLAVAGAGPGGAPAVDLTGDGPPVAAPAAAPLPEILRQLTARERDVLLLVAQGRSNREVADELFISQKTVSVHVSHILAKLGVRTRVQATALVHQLETAG